MADENSRENTGIEPEVEGHLAARSEDGERDPAAGSEKAMAARQAARSASAEDAPEVEGHLAARSDDAEKSGDEGEGSFHF